MSDAIRPAAVSAADASPATPRPITILIAALGGEGGGVLADWLLFAATSAGLPVQSTSIPGVAQRTGATTYYLEVFPVPTAQLDKEKHGKRPIFALTPTPGNIDIMVASELVEAGRALQNGWVTGRTTLIASSHRIYATIEKMPMGDGRYEAQRIIDAAPQLAGRAILFDMAAAAQQTGTVISAVMFGAMAAVLANQGKLPLSRAMCEGAIKASGKGIEASLRGFAAGFNGASAGALANQAIPEPISGDKALKPAPAALVGAKGSLASFPEHAHYLITEGIKRLIDYQDRAYAELYLERLKPIAHHDASGGKLTAETARYLALWMSFEDLIRVADLKTRASRFERVRKDVIAKPDEPIHIIEFLKPGLDEITGMLPPGMSKRVRAWAVKNGWEHKLSVGMHLKTNSVAGFLMLRTAAGLRFWRRRTARYAEETQLIERWLAAVTKAAQANPASPRLAFEITLTARLIKGYSDTNKRGKANFNRIFDNLVEGTAVSGDEAKADAIFAAREAALADPDGKNLDKALGKHGVAPQAVKEVPIRFVKPVMRP